MCEISIPLIVNETELELVEATGWPRLCSGAADKLDQKTAEEAVADPLFSFLCVFVFAHSANVIRFTSVHTYIYIFY